MGNNLPDEKEAVDQIKLPPKWSLLLQDLEDISHQINITSETDRNAMAGSPTQTECKIDTHAILEGFITHAYQTRNHLTLRKFTLVRIISLPVLRNRFAAPHVHRCCWRRYAFRLLGSSLLTYDCNSKFLASHVTCKNIIADPAFLKYTALITFSILSCCLLTVISFSYCIF